MPNTAHTQTTQSIYQYQYKSETQQNAASRVVQDKRALMRARIASRKPAADKFLVRAQQKNKNSPRSQNHSNSQSAAVKITVWVKPLVKAELQRIAAQEGLTLSATAAAFLNEAVRQKLHVQHSVLLQPIIQTAIAKQMQSYSNRIAVLLIRSLFTTEQTRILTTNILGRMQGVTPEALNEILDRSYSAAKGKIIKRNKQLECLLEEVKQWLNQQEQDENKTDE